MTISPSMVSESTGFINMQSATSSSISQTSPSMSNTQIMAGSTLESVAFLDASLQKYDDDASTPTNNPSLHWLQGNGPKFPPLENAHYQIAPLSSSPLFSSESEIPATASYSLSQPTTGPTSTCFVGDQNVDRWTPRNYPSLLVPQLSRAFDLREESYPPSTYELNPNLQNHVSEFSLEDYLQHNILPDGDMFSYPLEGFKGQSQPQTQPHDVLDSIETGGRPYFPQNTTQSLGGAPRTQNLMKTLFTEEYEREDTVDESVTDKEEPYAKLIYRCLMEAPNHTMVLRDIYEWFKTNTDKGREPHVKGWQNSIRHNLSMNKAFQKIDQTLGDEARRGYVWRLSEQALKDGCVQSTTRYRNKQPNKRGSKSYNPTPNRQASGSKGSETSRKIAYLRRSERLRNLQEVDDNFGSTAFLRCRVGDPIRQGYFGTPPRSVTSDRFSTEPLAGYRPDSCSQSARVMGIQMEQNMMYQGQSTQFSAVGHSLQASHAPPKAIFSYSSTPDFRITEPLDDPLMIMPDRIFYDSPESASEPRTPGAFSDLNIEPGPQDFFNGGLTDDFLPSSSGFQGFADAKFSIPSSPRPSLR